jgi:hypothetical protein
VLWIVRLALARHAFGMARRASVPKIGFQIGPESRRRSDPPLISLGKSGLLTQFANSRASSSWKVTAGGTAREPDRFC